MIQRKFYLPQEMYNRLQLLAMTSKKTITDVLRELIAEGLERQQKRIAGASTRGFLKIAEMAEKEGWTGPGDLSVNHDKYSVETWEEQHPYMKSKTRKNK